MDILKVNAISINFGGVKAVKEVDLTVEQGRIVGIIGPNGSGKTTLFNILTGIYRPTSGTFRFMGKDLTGWPSHRIARAGMARTFQNIRLFKNMSVMENVLVGEHTQIPTSTLAAIFRPGQNLAEVTARAEAERLLDFVGLRDKVKEFASNLSYGEQRRLELARALATCPRLLLLDEPTAGMNPSEAVQIMELIRTIRKKLGVTILLIEHNMQVMMGVAECIAALDAGSKIAEGTPREIQYNPKVIQAYLGEEQ